ncbi:MAG: hypothetical protein R3E01_24900 [Pirellulaceae bacterium]|nr:hypothetical protein [Planctomycetales bacterium]
MNRAPRDFLLLSLLSALLVLGYCCCASPLADAAEDEAEQKSIAAIEEFGGYVRSVAASVPWKEAGFVRLDKPLTDDALQQLSHVQHLVWLYLQGAQITDDQLKHLVSLTELKKLHLENTPITDAGLQHLLPLKQLEYLNLYGTKVSDQGLDVLKQMPSLKQVYLWQTQVTEDGAQSLRAALEGTEVVLASSFKPLPPAEPAKEPEQEAAASPLANPLTQGQVVRVRLTGGDKILSLAEVKVYSFPDAKPIESGSEASQSSVDYNGEPKRAYDGNTDQVYANGSVTHTKAESYPWWQVRLKESQPIGKIIVFNRGDCCGDRLQGAIIEVLDPALQVVWSATINDAKDGSQHEFVAP